MSANLVEHVAPLEDLRIDRNKLHGLVDMVLLTICAVASGADGWEAIKHFGHEKLDWLQLFGPFRNGVPSHDCMANVVSRLSPQGFQACLLSWMRAVAQVAGGDGRSGRRAAGGPRPEKATGSPPGPRRVCVAPR